jgi:hypothetical protein
MDDVLYYHNFSQVLLGNIVHFWKGAVPEVVGLYVCFITDTRFEWYKANLTVLSLPLA